MGLIKGAYSFLTSLGGSSADPGAHESSQPAAGSSTQQIVQGQSDIVILVVGRSGTGKTSLINEFCSPSTSGVLPRYQSTTEAITCRAELYEPRFKLIDTPGFDNTRLSDVAVCARIAEYFWDKRRYHLGVNGIIYIHQAGDPLQSRSLRRYLTVILRIFLGNAGMHRLTIYIPHINPNGQDAAQINEDLRDNHSILGEFSAMGAKVTWASGGLEGFTNIVKSYKPRRPIVLPIQDYNPNLVSELEEILHEKPIQSHSGNQDSRVRTYQRKLEELHSTLDAKEGEIVRYHDAYQQLKNLHASQQDTETALRQQLQQIQREYASLRSELQLQENFEQSEIVQELEDLNRSIDDISRSVSAYLTDNYARATFKKEPGEVTALDAHNPTELFRLLGYDNGKSSLISSVKGEGLDIENFLDFTIRDMLCSLLVAAIFQPFHPAIDTEQSDMLLRAYEDIQKREPQTRSGKWRSSTFKSIYKDDSPDQVATWINGLLHRFARTRLNPLITCVFGSKNAAFDRQHFNQIYELVKRALDWNAKLKGEVVVLGDFRQTMHVPHSKFDPNTMMDFEAQPNTQPTSVLGTVGLGLISLRAVGGGQPPEETLVCKAAVTTDTLYATVHSD
ncbi:GH11692 gene product from transcript GH11692-RA [Rhizoctonia solani]|uniref:GH11692 gene product from transcript GH11692-RA n=1 Tax=Rhizoctonia solani TaxID=456999 RepID=A0A0K6GF48_9AGAM|nr:GH11692 gene product from transcript GH11692-RA [Rhizoctonia solani]